jgi:hypothetical protein
MSPEASPGWRDPRHVLLAVAGVVLIAHSLAFNFVTDDAYISFVFSRNLAEHGELSFNLGSPVEGYTNFLWTVVLGGLMALGISPEWSSRVLGTACALGTLLVAFRLTERALGRPTPWAVLPALLLASSSGYACWSSGGLETQLFTLLVTLAIDGFVAGSGRQMRTMGVWLALASMTRPEGPMIAAVLGAARVGHKALARAWRPTKDELLAVAWFLALWAPWFAWRWWYYGYPFPNTYYVKAHGPWAAPGMAAEMRDHGLYYVWVWLKQTGLLYALPVAAIGLGAARPGTPRFTLTSTLALLAAVYLPYAVSVGGDFMGLHRFIMPVFVVAAIAVTLGLEWLVGRFAAGHARIGLAAAAVVALGFAATQLALTRQSLRADNLANDQGIDTPAFLIVYTEDRAAIGRAMAPCFRDDDFAIVGGAGAQPYFGRMRAIDVYGLISEKIAHDEPRIRARAGHTKWGSDAVLLSYDPTFMFACYAIHGKPDQPRLDCAGGWLARGYEEVTMHIPGMRQQGEYYTFLAKQARAFACPGRVH